MPDDPSHRELAAICLAMAKRASGLRVRASLLKIAQKWHDLAEIDDRDAARLRAVQREIGRELRTHYELPKELPHRVFTLLMQLDAEQSGKTRF